MDVIYTLTLMFVVLIGSVVSYSYYLKEKKVELDSIREGKCPKCGQKEVEVTDQRSGGCSGTKVVSFECKGCGYANTFTIEGQSSCGL